MITVEYHRNNGYEAPVMVHEKTQGAALTSLVQFELGYGGHIIEVSPTRVVVRTILVGCRDTVIFSGTSDAMRRIVLAATVATHVLCEKRCVSALAKGATSSLKEYCADEAGGMRPFLITHLAPLIAGNTVAKLSLFGAMEVSDEQEVLRLSVLKLEDLVALAEIALESGTSLLEAATALEYVA